MSSFVLKIIGIISMLCDHYSDVIIGENTYLNLIGRIALPIFAFQTAQSYIHSSNIKKYMLRLFIFACISQFSFFVYKTMFGTKVELNVLFTFLFGIFALIAYDKIKNNYLGFSVVVIISLIAELLKTDFRWFGVACVFMFYIYSKSIDRKYEIKKLILLFVAFVVLVILFYLKQIILYPDNIIFILKVILSTCMALIPIYLYNGKRGYKIKYLFYIFYPLHFLVLWLLNIFI